MEGELDLNTSSSASINLACTDAETDLGLGQGDDGDAKISASDIPSPAILGPLDNPEPFTTTNIVKRQNTPTSSILRNPNSLSVDRAFAIRASILSMILELWALGNNSVWLFSSWAFVLVSVSAMVRLEQRSSSSRRVARLGLSVFVLTPAPLLTI